MIAHRTRLLFVLLFVVVAGLLASEQWLDLSADVREILIAALKVALGVISGGALLDASVTELRRRDPAVPALRDDVIRTDLENLENLEKRRRR